MSSTININVQNSGYLEKFKYPMGEWQVRVRPQYISRIHAADYVVIVSRIESSDDLIQTILACDAIYKCTRIEAFISLVLPYLPYARADRRFVVGDCDGLLVFSNLLDAASCDEILTLDVHSGRATTITNVENVSPKPFVIQAVTDFAKRNKAKHLNVLFPDNGASTRYEKMLPEYIGSNRMYTKLSPWYCKKIRDPKTGKFKGFKVPHIVDDPTIIIDDICDGGGTFIGIAHELYNAKHTAPLALYTTHGIYSKGFQALAECFDRLYTTDSVNAEAIDTNLVTVYKSLPELLKESAGNRKR